MTSHQQTNHFKPSFYCLQTQHSSYFFYKFIHKFCQHPCWRVCWGKNLRELGKKQKCRDFLLSFIFYFLSLPSSRFSSLFLFLNFLSGYWMPLTPTRYANRNFGLCKISFSLVTRSLYGWSTQKSGEERFRQRKTKHKAHEVRTSWDESSG